MCIKFVTSDVTLWHLHMEKHGILKYVDTTLTFTISIFHIFALTSLCFYPFNQH